MPSLRTLFLGLVAVVLLVILAWLVWTAWGEPEPRAAYVDFASLLPAGRTFVNSVQVAGANDQATKEWIVLYRRKDDARCIYGCLYRAQPDQPTIPQTLVPQQLTAASGAEICLGEQRCTVETKDILKNYGGPRELLVWGYRDDLRTRLNLFYWDGARYVHYPHSFEGDRGVLLEGETTIIVKKTIQVGEEPLPRNALCQRQVYEQQNGMYLDIPSYSTVAFRHDRIPETYPTEPDEVVVAFCLQYQNESARKRYLAQGADVSLTTPGGFGCMGPAGKVEVLRFLNPTSEAGNWASVQVEIQIDNQVRRNTNWTLHYATGDNSDKWRWQIVSCASQ